MSGTIGACIHLRIAHVCLQANVFLVLAHRVYMMSCDDVNAINLFNTAIIVHLMRH